jgi:hypothetical protein
LLFRCHVSLSPNAAKRCFFIYYVVSISFLSFLVCRLLCRKPKNCAALQSSPRDSITEWAVRCLRKTITPRHFLKNKPRQKFHAIRQILHLHRKRQNARARRRCTGPKKIALAPVPCHIPRRRQRHMLKPGGAQESNGKTSTRSGIKWTDPCCRFPPQARPITPGTSRTAVRQTDR